MSKHQLFNYIFHISYCSTKKTAVIRFPRFIEETDPERVYNNRLNLYQPHRTHTLKPPQYNTYEEYHNNGRYTDNSDNTTTIKELVEQKEKLFSTLSENTLDQAFETMAENDHSDAWADIAPISEQHRINTKPTTPQPNADEDIEDIPELSTFDAHSTKNVPLYTIHKSETTISNDEGIKIIQNLNTEQKTIFNHIISCTRKLHHHVELLPESY